MTNVRLVLQRNAVERVIESKVVANYPRLAEEPVIVLEVQSRLAHVRVMENQARVRRSGRGIVDVDV